MRRRRAMQLAGGLLGTVAVVGVVLVATATAHTPATFEFGEAPVAITSKTDGTPANAHHVIFIPGLNEITCTAAALEGQASGILTVSIRLDASYLNCKIGSEDVTISMESCEFAFNANGEVSISSKLGENCKTKPILITTKSGCEVRIGEQTLLGVGYTNINSSGFSPDVTIGLTLTKITGTRSVGCGNPGTFTTGEYTTGNTIVYAEQVGTKNLVSMKWKATVP